MNFLFVHINYLRHGCCDVFPFYLYPSSLFYIYILDDIYDVMSNHNSGYARGGLNVWGI
jgi:hypothetical protein